MERNSILGTSVLDPRDLDEVRIQISTSVAGFLDEQWIKLNAFKKTNFLKIPPTNLGEC